MRISDWSSDVCSSDLPVLAADDQPHRSAATGIEAGKSVMRSTCLKLLLCSRRARNQGAEFHVRNSRHYQPRRCRRSEEHTSELQSLMRISYAVFCLKKKNIDTMNYDLIDLR